MTFDIAKLHNTYFVVRHGKSVANEEGIIVSDPASGTTAYGLTAEGKLEVRQSAEEKIKEYKLTPSTIIISSDFTRARETAKIIADTLGVKDITFTPSLRERFFGEWEATHNSNYQKVWDADKNDHTHKNQKVESVAEVLKRALELIAELEERYTGKNILLVSHGDTLQILQTAFKGVHPSEHRTLTHLKTGEIRRLN